MMRRIEAKITAFLAVIIRSCFVAFLVITEKSASVDEGFTIIRSGMNTSKNSWNIAELSETCFINLFQKW
jgi:hypothetical protein